MSRPLAELSEEEFKNAIANGQTLNMREVNAALGLAHVDKESLTAMRIPYRLERTAVHILATDLPRVCAALILHLAQVGALYRRGAPSGGPS